uniref:Methyltransferase 4, N6-adenosine n=1 Tax=Salvator merianae TaxID=96440 RepID=A0A8D0DT03_SALMN
MSVICRLSAGWLLDHLSFINKSGYEVCYSSDTFGGTSFENPIITTSPNGNLNMATAPSITNTCKNNSLSEIKVMEKNEDKTVKKTYIFREEFFNVLKPHIATDFQSEKQQMSFVDNLENSGLEQQKEVKSDSDVTAKTKKKRKRRSEFNQGERDAMEYHLKISSVILESSRQLIQEALRSGYFQSSPRKHICASNIPVTEHSNCGLAELCEMAKQFPPENEREQKVNRINKESSVPEQVQVSCITENTTNFATIVTLMGQKYLFPPKSAFLLSDISFMHPLLDNKKKFGIIVLDPPWENKSVKRSKRYSYLTQWQIKQIPVPALAAPDCLVVTWVTNRQKHLKFVKNELYPHWSVAGMVEWFWIKITKSGEFVFPLNSFHKKPYEVLVLGRVQRKDDLPLRISEDQMLPLPDQKLIVSVPCILHSHKPPLAEVLKEFAKPDVECLELFARNLQPGWTSWGNEVLKFQNVDYFTALQNNTD